MHAAATLLGASVYGIPELHREAIANAPVVGNPGCFAVGIVLGLAPLFQDGLIDGGQIHVDGLTGSSGAGKTPLPTLHFSHLSDSVVPYRVLSHRRNDRLPPWARRRGPKSTSFPTCSASRRGILNTTHGRLTRPHLEPPCSIATASTTRATPACGCSTLPDAQGATWLQLLRRLGVHRGQRFTRRRRQRARQLAQEAERAGDAEPQPHVRPAGDGRTRPGAAPPVAVAYRAAQ